MTPRIVRTPFIVETQNDKHHSFHAYCPACKSAHSFDVGRWQFNGSMDKPTFSPSMLVTWSRKDSPNGPDIEMGRCHSFLRDGVWQFLGDCKHDMKNQNVPVVPFPETYGFGIGDE